jgi:hypothetical protein
MEGGTIVPQVGGCLEQQKCFFYSFGGWEFDVQALSGLLPQGPLTQASSWLMQTLEVP